MPTLPRPLAGCLEVLEPRIAPATFVVSSNQDLTSLDPGYYSTLRGAVFLSEQNGPGKDTIVFDPVAFPADSAIKLIKLDHGDILITGNLDIKGLGPDRVVISGNSASRIFTISDGDASVVRTVSISGVTLTAGNGVSSALPGSTNSGGAIYSEETLIIKNTILSGNKAAASGGGIASVGQGSLTISGSVVTGNDATGVLGGGVLATLVGKSSLNISSSLFSNNVSGGAGGGVLVVAVATSGSLTIQDTVFASNEATADVGGGLALLANAGSAKLSIQGGSFSDNLAGSSGGAISLTANAGVSLSAQLSGVTISGNSAETAGGLFAVADPAASKFALSIKGSLFANNTATQAALPLIFSNGVGGGASILLGSDVMTVAMQKTAFVGNESGTHAGALWADSVTLVASGILVQGNEATLRAGGLALVDSDSKISNSSISGNTATEGGGLWNHALYQGANLTLSKVAVTGNEATKAGGGIHVSAPYLSEVKILGSTITGNSAGKGGGGLLLEGVGLDVLVSGGEISANAAGSSGGGIFAYMSGSSSVVINGTRISGNVAGFGGGIFAYAAGASSLLLGKAVVSQNLSENSGGGLHLLTNAAGSFAISGTKILDNVSTVEGGGVYAKRTSFGEITITKTLIEGNLALAFGGGLRSGGLDVVVDKTVRISGNVSTGNFGNSNVSGALDGFVAQVVKSTKGTFVVTDNADLGPGTLRQAILDANASGKAASIGFDASMSGKTITLATALPTITGSLTINGLGRDQVAISGAYSARILTFDSSLVPGQGVQSSKMSGLTLMKGEVLGAGAAIQNFDSLAIRDSAFALNYSNRGGAIYHGSYKGGTKFTIERSLFVSNVSKSEGGAAAIFAEGKVAISNSVLSANYSKGNGGGLYVNLERTSKSKPVLAISGSALAGNVAFGGSGGGLQGSDVSGAGVAMSITSSIFNANEATKAGGGVVLHSTIAVSSAPPTTFKVQGVTIANNEATRGGGLSFSTTPGDTATLTINGSIFSNNEASLDGGGFSMQDAGGATITKSVFAGNEAAKSGGGALFSDSNASLKFVEFLGNQAQTGGGLGVVGLSGVVAANGHFAGNEAKTGGGASMIGGFLSLGKSTFVGNSASSSGGAVLANTEGTLTIVGSILAGNSSKTDGGAIAASDPFLPEVSLVISKSTFTANTSSNGGAISASIDGVASILASKFQGNVASAGIGGAIFFTGSDSLSIRGSLFAANHAVSQGGAIFLVGDLSTDLTKSSVTRNTSEASGGGIRLSTGTLLIDSSTIQGNAAVSKGGGLYSTSIFTPQLIKSSITGNFAPVSPNQA